MSIAFNLILVIPLSMDKTLKNEFCIMVLSGEIILQILVLAVRHPTI